MSDFPQDNLTYDSIVATATASVKPVTVTEETGQALVHALPTGYRVEVTDLTKLVLDQERAQRKHAAEVAGRPERKAGSYSVSTIGSFLALFDKHTTEHAEIWVSETSIKAVLNAASKDDASFEDLSITMPLQWSPEWQAWTRISGKFLAQADFAEFVEANASNFLKPAMNTALEVAQSLEASTDVAFKSAARNSDGQRAFRYEETTTAKAGQKGELKIPDKFTLALRVFDAAQDAIEVTARFRYRIRSDALSLGIVIDQLDLIRDAAIELLVNQIAQHTGDRALVLRGTGRQR